MIDFQACAILLGIYLCGLGASAGSKFVSLRVWMGVSCAIGLGSFWLWCHSLPNAYISNIWILLNIIVLLPFVSLFSLNSCKPGIYAIVGICAWLWFVHAINNGIHAYAPMLRVVVSLAMVASCGLAALSGEHRVLLVTLAIAAMCDAVLYSFSLEWFRYNPPHGAWAIRNLVWCGFYLAAAYTVRRR